MEIFRKYGNGWMIMKNVKNGGKLLENDKKL